MGSTGRVDGGIAAAVGAVRARVTLVPLPPAIRAASFRPEEVEAAFDAASAASTAPYQSLAKRKAGEHTPRGVSGLLK